MSIDLHHLIRCKTPPYPLYMTITIKSAMKIINQTQLFGNYINKADRRLCTSASATYRICHHYPPYNEKPIEVDNNYPTLRTSVTTISKPIIDSTSTPSKCQFRLKYKVNSLQYQHQLQQLRYKLQ